MIVALPLPLGALVRATSHSDTRIERWSPEDSRLRPVLRADWHGNAMRGRTGSALCDERRSIARDKHRWESACIRL